VHDIRRMIGLDPPAIRKLVQDTALVYRRHG
jgi:hypothetical protein